MIPIEVVIHRAAAAVAIGLIAAGAENRRNALVGGIVLWLAVLLVAVV